VKIFARSRPTAAATNEALLVDMEAEVACGRRFYEAGLIEQAYMDPSYSQTFMILEAESIEEARTQFNTYPHVQRGLIEFEFSPLIGMPAVKQSFEGLNLPRPPWWPDQPDATRSNRAAALRFYAEALGQRDEEVFRAVVHPDVVVHSGIEPLHAIRGRDAYWRALGRLAAFSIQSFELEDLVAVGDRVLAKFRAEAVHRGDELGVPATGKSIVMWEIHLSRWRQGQMIENFAADINYDWPWLVASAYPDGIGRTGREPT
jgi:predicted ester cyclase